MKGQESNMHKLFYLWTKQVVNATYDVSDMSNLKLSVTLGSRYKNLYCKLDPLFVILYKYDIALIISTKIL